jgi:ArsR family transcriptional regulator
MKSKVQIFKGLADEVRLRILSLLLTEGELCVCDIIAALRLPQSTISRHLAYLRKSGLVNDRRCGLWMYYSVVTNGDDFLQGLIDVLKQNLVSTMTSTADRKCLENVVKNSRCA